MYERKKESGMFWFVISFLFSRIIALIILFVIVFYFKLLINKSKIWAVYFIKLLRIQELLSILEKMVQNTRNETKD